MDSRIKELTDKIYQEGVEKGHQEATQILANAKQQSEEMIAKAEAEAQRIVSEAQRQATDLTKHAQSELKLYAEQVVSSTHSAIADSLTDRIVRDNVKALTTDPAFMQKLILTIAQQWTAGEPMIIETAEAQALEQYMMSNAKALLDTGQVTIKAGDLQGSDFRVSPVDGSYKIVFGEEEFVNFFKSFLRPRLVETLF